MKRVFVEISHFGSGQEGYLQRVLDQYAAVRSFRIELLIDHTEPLTVRLPETLIVRLRRFPPEIGMALPFVHRGVFAQCVEEYDLFVYTENDMLITEDNLQAYCELSALLPPEYLTGFLRFEERDGARYLIDAHRSFPVFQRAVESIGERRWFSIANLHQGSTVLTRAQLQRALASRQFVVPPHQSSAYGALECGATDAYSQCGFQHKVLPAGPELARLLIWHMPNKYVQKGGIWDTPGAHTLQSLSELFGFAL